jgi:hypothetical protein
MTREVSQGAGEREGELKDQTRSCRPSERVGTFVTSPPIPYPLLHMPRFPLRLPPSETVALRPLVQLMPYPGGNIYAPDV